jgi:hypothetical protein
MLGGTLATLKVEGARDTSIPVDDPNEDSTRDPTGPRMVALDALPSSIAFA